MLYTKVFNRYLLMKFATRHVLVEGRILFKVIRIGQFFRPFCYIKAYLRRHSVIVICCLFFKSLLFFFFWYTLQVSIVRRRGYKFSCIWKTMQSQSSSNIWRIIPSISGFILTNYYYFFSEFIKRVVSFNPL